MKFSAAIPMLAALAPVASAFNVHVRSSDDLIDVGDLDLLKETWQAIYAAAGNREAVTIGPPAIATQNQPCHFNGHTDHHVTLTIEGHWDDVGGNHHEYRDAMVEAAWAALQRLSDKHSYNIWKDCCAETISTNCAAPGANGCNFEACHCPGAPNSRCHTLAKGHKVPSLLNVYTTKNGAATANTLRIAFRSDTREEKGGCGVVEVVAKGLATFLFPAPVANLVGTGIDLQCA